MRPAFPVILACLLIPMVSSAQLNTQFIDENITSLSYQGTSVKATLIRSGGDAILVDTMYDTLAIAIRDYIEKEGLKLMYIINTHYHGDHTGGNSHFKWVTKIAHSNTNELIDNKAEYGPPDSFKNEDYPSLLFNDRLTLYLGDIHVEVVHYGSGHTSGDALVFVPESNVLITGDVMLDARHTLPFFPDPEEGLAVLERLLENTDNNTQVITGHGKIGSRNDIVDLVAIMKSTISYSKSARDPEQFPEEWKSWDSNFMTMSAWMEMLDKIYN